MKVRVAGTAAAAAAAAYVQANRGAIGYLPAGADPGRAKVITLR